MSDFSGVSSQPGIKGLQTPPTYTPTTKSLTYPGSGGSAAVDPQLASWYEQAYAYYNAVMSGDPSTPKPDAASWNSFMEQMQWASQQLGYAQGGPTMVGGAPPPAGPGAGAQAGQSNQFGGVYGPMGSWTYTSEKSEIGFTGDGTHDIWSNQTIIDVAPTSAKVTVENTNDTRSTPAEAVVKITVTDPATGTQATYYVHNYDPSKDTIKINTPDTTQVTNNTGDTTSITTGKFTQGGAGAAGSKPDASVAGETQADGSIVYEPDYAGGTIDFFANPGDNQTAIVYSDANISVKPSDNVNATKVGDTTVITVTHRDGSTDTYKIQKGYKANVNVNAQYITYGNPPVSSDTVPSELSDSLTLNGGVGTSTSTSGAANADTIVSGLLSATSRTEPQLINALKAAGYSYNTIDDLKKAITDGHFPPNPPDGHIVDFLRRLDGDLATDCTNLTALLGAGSDKDTDKKSKTQTVQDRLVTLLQALYPDSIINGGSLASANFGGKIEINGSDFNWSLQTNGELDGSM